MPLTPSNIVYYSNILVEDYLNSLPDDTEFINVSDRKISHLPSLKRFYHLKTLLCSNNQLTSLPELNSSLEKLFCGYNKLTSLPEVKNTSLKILSCNHNQLTRLPELNPSLEELNCSCNSLTSLPDIKNTSLKILFCEMNQLTHLPNLTPCLLQLNCYRNELIQLPRLNLSLRKLFCFANELTSLPELNPSLHRLSCIDNLLPPILNYDGFLGENKRHELNHIIRVLNHFKELFWCLKYKQKFRDWLWKKIRLPKIEKEYHPDKLRELLCEMDENEELDHVLSTW